ncbi:MAG TPA: LysR family transcriptional regulator [Bryobacteraceae bacterium]|nr:LysR family transcriptional regulator [Bryobacteraceae bacterium]
MGLEKLRLFRDVVQHHSISKGGRAGGITQSAASQQVQEIEKQLGTALLDRSTRPFTVTPAGKLYLDYCRDMLRRHDEFEAELNRLEHKISGTVRLAAIYSVALSEMSAIESRFSARYPGAAIQVSYLRPERVYEAVSEDQADLGLMSYAESSRNVIALPWRDEEMVVALAPNHRLAACKSVAASALEGELFVGFDEDLPIRHEIERYLRDRRVNVDVVLHFDNLQMIKEAVVHGAGISIMPKRVMREDLAHGRLVALRLRPAELYRPVRIVHRRRKVFSEIAGGLLALLREESAATV